ncbi:unnamed protein product [Prorocentrum cordatum]|uniref:Uncharacterized protein n=1 Tax=Prorocentrum cordatum TaxID=2364126 RepID=A0ABN9PU69_9DINO|nr:unnamed protein product [Polarella glacialis]
MRPSCNPRQSQFRTRGRGEQAEEAESGHSGREPCRPRGARWCRACSSKKRRGRRGGRGRRRKLNEPREDRGEDSTCCNRARPRETTLRTDIRPHETTRRTDIRSLLREAAATSGPCPTIAAECVWRISGRKPVAPCIDVSRIRPGRARKSANRSEGRFCNCPGPLPPCTGAGGNAPEGKCPEHLPGKLPKSWRQSEGKTIGDLLTRVNAPETNAHSLSQRMQHVRKPHRDTMFLQPTLGMLAVVWTSFGGRQRMRALGLWALEHVEPLHNWKQPLAPATARCLQGLCSEGRDNAGSSLHSAYDSIQRGNQSSYPSRGPSKVCYTTAVPETIFVAAAAGPLLHWHQALSAMISMGLRRRNLNCGAPPKARERGNPPP